MKIEIKKILLESDYLDQVPNAIINYDNTINAYKDLEDRGLSTMERQYMLKGINNLTGSNHITRENLNPDDIGDKMLMNMGKIAYPDNALINDYLDQEKDNQFRNEAQKHIETNNELNNAQTQGKINAAIGLAAGAGGMALANRLKNRR